MTRGRLTHECRGFGGCGVIDQTYTYDDGGNRRTKVDAVSDTRVDCTYDNESTPSQPPLRV